MSPLPPKTPLVRRHKGYVMVEKTCLKKKKFVN